LNLQNSSETKAANKFPIVGIGASAGGLEPITKLLENLPIQTGLSFVVIQHLATSQESMLPEILSRSTKMKVKQATDGMRIEKDHVYVIPPGTTLMLKKNCIKLLPKKPLFKPINDFLVSLASEQKTQAIGIVLSGTGNDGTEGLKAVKAEGGITFAQNPETAQYPDMPKNAIAAGTPDFILSPEQIARELSRIAKLPQLIPLETKIPEQEKVETELKKILTLLKGSFGVDFSHYRVTTINRRITRRMVINKTDNIKAYVEYLRAHPSEQQVLFDDMLIGVTSFFREPDTFIALKEKVFPELLKNRFSEEPIRVWVPGCSTGEEVYSLAITIQEFLEEKGPTDARIQIFGTDANEKNIEKSRQGTYPKSIEDKVSENRLKRFFASDNGHYRIIKSIRDMCIFAKQDITTDPPFSNVDLIMCRNVLIYFDEYLHQKVLPIFHYGLKPNGFLVLGESESIGKFQNLFEPIIPKGLIYRKKQAVQQATFGDGAFVPYAAIKTKPLEKKDMLTVLGGQVDRLIMTEYGPATLLVNSGLDILVFRGDVAPYLSPESGAASLNLTKIIRKELRSQVQTAVFRARKENKVFKETVHYKQKGQSKTVNIEIRPLKTAEYTEHFYLVLFAEVVSQNQPEVFEASLLPTEIENLKDRQIRELKEDLVATKESLQTLVEGQEATNEELRSSMEEVQSSNEELMSTNEELETAKEELQSGNEELQTLNEEMKNRNQALGRLNDDLANLQVNIDLPVVIVDNDLKIRRFTSSAQDFLRISPSDVGRSIASVKPGVFAVDLEKTIKDVIVKLAAVNREVACADDRLCEMRVRPYLTEEKKIDGAVLSFADITERKKSEQALKKSEEEYSSLFANMIDGFAYCQMIFDETGKPVDFVYLQINDAFERITGLQRGLVVGKRVTQAIPGIRETNPELFEIYGRVALTGKKEKFTVFFNPLSMWLSISVYSPLKGYFAAVFEDITERKKTETEREIMVEFLRIANATTSTHDLIKGTLDFFQKQSGCEAVGIRLKEGDDYPYYETRGFPPQHVKLENKLCASDKAGCLIRDSKGLPILECMCGNIICGRFDPAKNFFTENGSFWTNDTTQLIANTTVSDRQGKTRNRCNREGYESVALIVMRVGDTRLGLLQLNDKRKGMFALETIQMWERIADRLAIALSRTIAEEALHKSELKYRDLSEHLEALVEERTKELKTSERLAAIGATAGMVGHDIRNPLQAITSDVYLAKSDLASTPESKNKNMALESLGEIEKNVDYINKIVADLQDFARFKSPKIEEIDLEQIIQEVLAVLNIPENVTVACSIGKDFPKLKTDKTYIQRILSNLSSNAIQAMPSGGKLTIAAIAKKGKATITVQDTGEGIPENVKSKIFTPLITTKAKGQGFGLPVVKKFTEALGGTVTFESDVGIGTKFIIEFPV
jgi:two-component system, chemotaxis family, CheB/CheR fusion protein